MTVDLDTAPDPISFAYWVPNVSGGLVVSKVEQRTSWQLEDNVRLAKTAEQVGFDYALSQVRFLSSYSAAEQHDAAAISLALLLGTERLKVIQAVLPELWSPVALAKYVLSSDNFSKGRAAINVVSGWFRDEYTSFGLPWLDHDERYRRSAEFLQVVRGLFNSHEAPFTFKGDFYRVNEASLRPGPYATARRAHPEIFQGGNSTAARRNGGLYSDIYFSNGKDFDGFTEQHDEVISVAASAGRPAPRFGLNGFAIIRETEAEAKAQLREIIENADRESVEGFRASVQTAGASTSDGRGMWADSSFEDLVQYNDGFRTKLIGTPEQVAHRILEYKRRGVDIMLLGVLHFADEIEHFGRTVIPIVRELEAEEARRGDLVGAVPTTH
ncbi:MAG: dimethylsulfone monooxygenase SfnG [Pseudoclavibacter sp.]